MPRLLGEPTGAHQMGAALVTELSLLLQRPLTLIKGSGAGEKQGQQQMPRRGTWDTPAPAPPLLM